MASPSDEHKLTTKVVNEPTPYSDICKLALQYVTDTDGFANGGVVVLVWNQLTRAALRKRLCLQVPIMVIGLDERGYAAKHVILVGDSAEPRGLLEHVHARQTWTVFTNPILAKYQCSACGKRDDNDMKCDACGVQMCDDCRSGVVDLQSKRLCIFCVKGRKIEV
jgi:hypothetical protein